MLVARTSAIQDWERSLARDARLTEHGILVLRITPRQIRRDGRHVADQIRSVLASSAGRRLLQIIAEPT